MTICDRRLSSHRNGVSLKNCTLGRHADHRRIACSPACVKRSWQSTVLRLRLDRDLPRVDLTPRHARNVRHPRLDAQVCVDSASRRRRSIQARAPNLEREAQRRQVVRANESPAPRSVRAAFVRPSADRRRRLAADRRSTSVACASARRRGLPGGRSIWCRVHTPPTAAIAPFSRMLGAHCTPAIRCRCDLASGRDEFRDGVADTSQGIGHMPYQRGSTVPLLAAIICEIRAGAKA